MKLVSKLLVTLLLGVLPTAQSNESRPPEFKSRFAGLVVHNATPAKSTHDARLHAKELLALAQLTHALIGGKADHGLCQSQAVEAMELAGGEASFARFKADVKQQGFKYEDVKITKDADTTKSLVHIFALQGHGHVLLGLWSPGKTKEAHAILTLCQTR